MRDEFVEFLLEQLAPLGAVSARAMFGGHGIYCDGLMFALVADQTLYLKVDAENRPRFVAAGLPPFVYIKNGKEMAMSYHLAPEAALDEPELLLDWAASARAAARRARRD